MKRLTGLLVIALAAGAGGVQADDAKKTPAADTKAKDNKETRDAKDAKDAKEAKEASKDAPKEASKDAPKDAGKDAPKEAGKQAGKEAGKDASGASTEVKAGTGVEKHEIVGAADSFPAGTTVWVWSRVVNGEGSIKHVWKRDGKEVWTATLPVGSKLWSTASRRMIPAAGSWAVDVQTDAGASLGTVSFTIQ